MCDGERECEVTAHAVCVCAVCACAVAGAFAHPCDLSVNWFVGVMELVALIALLCGVSGEHVGSFVVHPALPFNGKSSNKQLY